MPASIRYASRTIITAPGSASSPAAIVHSPSRSTFAGLACTQPDGQPSAHSVVKVSVA
jgi:hypothetical protein